MNQREVKFRAWNTGDVGLVYKKIVYKQGKIIDMDKSEVERYEDRCIKRPRLKNKMVYFELTQLDGNYIVPSGSYLDRETIIMQHVGLKDKNGKEIYQGDILEFDNGDRGYIDCEDFLQFFCEFIGEWEYEDQVQELDDIIYGKIIGNVYENPELLERR